MPNRDDLTTKETDNGVTISVKVVPGSSRTRLAGLYDDALKVNIAAAPEKGKANKELTQFLARLLGVSKSAVSVVGGQHDPRKQLHIVGLTAEELHELIAEHLSG